MKVIRTLLLIFLLLGFVALWQVYSYYKSPLPFSGGNRIVTVQKGDSLRKIGSDLYERGIISSTKAFEFWARVFGHQSKIKIGEYGVPEGTSLHGLFGILLSGKSLGHRIVVPEGIRAYDIAQILEKEGLCTAEEFLRVTRDKEFIQALLGEEQYHLEGYLFPDTYFFTKIDGPRLIAQRMVNRFLEVYKNVPQRPDMNRHQVVTLASIIEKETGAPFERKTISSVFHNRMKKGMRLQTDPTVLYAMMLRHGKTVNNITRADLQTDLPYNTYTRAGLPPGPIASPGYEALVAAVEPDETNFFYFVSRNDGTHVFSESYGDHNKAVGKFQLDPKARAGKSWRDLNKKKLKK